MKTGHIRIIDKVYFEYYDDGKPEHKLLSEFFGFDTDMHLTQLYNLYLNRKEKNESRTHRNNRQD